MPKRRKDFYAIVWPLGRWRIEPTWHDAEKHIKGQAVKHRSFWDRDEAIAWIDRVITKQEQRAEGPTFPRGILPDLARFDWREKLIGEQFNIMKDAGLI